MGAFHWEFSGISLPMHWSSAGRRHFLYSKIEHSPSLAGCFREEACYLWALPWLITNRTLLPNSSRLLSEFPQITSTLVISVKLVNPSEFSAHTISYGYSAIASDAGCYQLPTTTGFITTLYVCWYSAIASDAGCYQLPTTTGFITTLYVCLR